MEVVKKIVKKFAIKATQLFEIDTLRRVLRRGVYVITYHSLQGLDIDPYVNNEVYRTTSQFEDDLRFFKKHFNVISAIDLVDLIKSNKPIPKNSLVITFDDGLRINHGVQIPILKKLNLKATFFINSAFVDNKELHFERKMNLIVQQLNAGDHGKVREYLMDCNIFFGDVIQSINRITYSGRGHLEEIAKLLYLDFKAYLVKNKPYLSTDEINEILNDGFSIGAHSIDHPKYWELSMQDQLDQTIRSLEFVTGKFNLGYRLFAFPYNDRGLTNEFFKKIQPYVDLTFGTNGFVGDSINFHIQRSEVETTQLPVDVAMKYRLLTSYLYPRRRKSI